MIKTLSTAVVTAAVGVMMWAGRAEACGCFAPPDPTVPVVQAGERILFAVNNGQVTAHIQIQYQGDAKDFGWLLPVPSVPTLKIGTEELFTQLIATTQPRYQVTVKATGNCQGFFGGGFGGLAPNASRGVSEDSSAGGGSPLVIQSSIGPYDYAVLKADNKDAMFKWLSDNRYFVPGGTDSVVGPYIRPGSFFLALKLQSGKSAGDIQPVVLNYPSDLPMIPIILTSVAAQPNMGIQVWMLGNGRAIPRNYRHVVLNDSQIDWLGLARNYNDVVIQANSEAPEKHAYHTEYAGTADVMKDVLDNPNRFGNQTDLAAQVTPVTFVQYLFSHNFAPVPATTNMGFRPTLQVLPPTLKALVLKAIPFPATLANRTTDDQFLSNLEFWLGSFKAQNPGLFVGYETNLNSAELAAEIFDKVVKPAREANTLFTQFPKLTRLYTTLSPEDMTRDPVFSFNPSLPDYSKDHNATYEVNCGVAGNQFNSPGRLITEQGWTVRYPNGQSGAPEKAFNQTGPRALRIETLAEEGAAVVEIDNTMPIRKAEGCSATGLGAGSLSLLAMLSLLRRRRGN